MKAYLEERRDRKVKDLESQISRYEDAIEFKKKKIEEIREKINDLNNPIGRPRKTNIHGELAMMKLREFMTLKEVGQVIGVCPDRARQVLAKAEMNIDFFRSGE